MMHHHAHAHMQHMTNVQHMTDVSYKCKIWCIIMRMRICNTWLIIHVCHDSFICVPWLIHMCATNKHMYMWCSVCACATRDSSCVIYDIVCYIWNICGIWNICDIWYSDTYICGMDDAVYHTHVHHVLSHVHVCHIHVCHSYAHLSHMYSISSVAAHAESCAIYDIVRYTWNEWVMSHMWRSHGTHMSESCHTNECVMKHIWVSRVTHTYE